MQLFNEKLWKDRKSKGILRISLEEKGRKTNHDILIVVRFSKECTNNFSFLPFSSGKQKNQMRCLLFQFIER